MINNKFNAATISWNTNIDLKGSEYKGRNTVVKNAMNDESSRVVLGKGFVPGDYNKGDLGHVAAAIVKVYRNERHVLTIPFSASEWIIREV